MHEFRIRAYRASDRAAVRSIVFATGFMGDPVDWLWGDPESFADLFTRYYTDREPESLFVAERDRTVVGYLSRSVDSGVSGGAAKREIGRLSNGSDIVALPRVLFRVRRCGNISPALRAARGLRRNRCSAVRARFRALAANRVVLRSIPGPGERLARIRALAHYTCSTIIRVRLARQPVKGAWAVDRNGGPRGWRSRPSCAAATIAVSVSAL